MNREIKFRAWDVKRDVMGKVGAMDWNAKQIISAHLCYKNGEVVKVYPEETVGDKIIFMQYTGLKDKDGKEIYEGDVLQHMDGGLSVVVFDDGSFVIEHRGKRGGSDFIAKYNYFEIIGNIYENPELLK